MHKCAYTAGVSFQWDPLKARANLEKHGIDFADVVGAFEDPRARTMPDPHPTEDRFVTVALDSLVRVLVIVWTQRDDEIRLISARKATRHERRQYEQEG